MKNPYFTSDEIYNKVIEGTDLIRKEVTKKNSSLFYVLNRYDTLIVIAVKYENITNTTFMIKKEGTFYIDHSKIIVTEPYHPKFEIIRKDNKLKQNDVEKYPLDYNGVDYPIGVMYKIKDLNHLELIAKGDLRKYFYPIKEYEIPAPPPPPDTYKYKPYKKE